MRRATVQDRRCSTRFCARAPDFDLVLSAAELVLLGQRRGQCSTLFYLVLPGPTLTAGFPNLRCLYRTTLAFQPPPDYGSGGWGFESLAARQTPSSEPIKQEELVGADLAVAVLTCVEGQVLRRNRRIRSGPPTWSAPAASGLLPSSRMEQRRAGRLAACESPAGRAPHGSRDSGAGIVTPRIPEPWTKVLNGGGVSAGGQETRYPQRELLPPPMWPAWMERAPFVDRHARRPPPKPSASRTRWDRVLRRNRLLHERLAAMAEPPAFLTGQWVAGSPRLTLVWDPHGHRVLMRPSPPGGAPRALARPSRCAGANRSRFGSDSSPAIPTSTRHNRPTRAEHDRLGGKIGREGDSAAVTLPLPPLFS
jgi:hypothetical protein